MSTPVSSTFDGLASVDRYGNLAPIVVDRLDDRYLSSDAAVQNVNAVLLDPTTPAGGLLAGLSTAVGVDATLRGVRGDGSNNGAALNDLIQSVSNGGGGTIILPPGRYAVPTLQGRSGVRVRAAIPGTATLVPTQQISVWARWNASAGFELHDLIIDGSNPAGGSFITSYGIEMSPGATDPVMRGCILRGFPIGIETRENVTGLRIVDVAASEVTLGIRLNKGPKNTRITGFEVSEWVDSGIYVLGDATSAVDGLVIERGIFHRHKRGLPEASVRQPIRFHGVTANRHRNVTIDGNTITGADTNHADTLDPGTADMISVHRLESFAITNNRLWGGGDVGITIAQGCRDGIVSGNRTERIDTVGVCLGSADSTDFTERVNVTGNTFINCALDRPDTGGQAITRSVPRAQASILAVRASNSTIGPNTLRYSPDHPREHRRGIAWRQCASITVHPQDMNNVTQVFYDDAVTSTGGINPSLASTNMTRVAVQTLTQTAPVA
ncbi:right-handed parallel beta-helix repeat-containing protein [Kytococcus sedentarius]|uniref:right-handed parallel beta-helix repeat-containing protein n=1 Tax=Kytococcus sedentarius TaxID=1276 RepID=UPI00387A341A